MKRSKRGTKVPGSRHNEMAERISELEKALKPFAKFVAVPTVQGDVKMPREGSVWLYVGERNDGEGVPPDRPHLHTDHFKTARRLTNDVV